MGATGIAAAVVVSTLDDDIVGFGDLHFFNGTEIVQNTRPADWVITPDIALSNPLEEIVGGMFSFHLELTRGTYADAAGASGSPRSSPPSLYHDTGYDSPSSPPPPPPAYRSSLPSPAADSGSVTTPAAGATLHECGGDLSLAPSKAHAQHLEQPDRACIYIICSRVRFVVDVRPQQNYLHITHYPCLADVQYCFFFDITSEVQFSSVQVNITEPDI
ncbi:hypothetical protein Pelo_1878 [Pelomyxa schiedti]|nr:hypothetical protein Pelo_1878 [Pelomyxa schiedti]